MIFSGYNGGGGVVALGAAAVPAVKALQQAIRALGQRVGNATLQITADGIMGPKTAAAVNLAFSQYLTNAPVPYRTGKLSQADIKTNAAVLTQYAGGAATGAAAPAPVKAAAAKTQSAAVKAVKQAVTTAKSPSIKALQQALHALGLATKDKVLQITADGIIGPKTIAAVNKAMTAYADGAPAEVRRGNFTKDEIVAGADTLAQYISRVSAARGVQPSAAKVAAAPTAKQNGKAVFSALQQALKSLGELVGNSTLSAVVADGIVGPKTAAAANIALTQYVGAAYAPAALRTGRLSTAAVASSAQQLTDVVNRENVRRAGAAAPEIMPAPVQQAAAAAEAQAAVAPEETYMPSDVPGAAASPQAAAQAVIQQQQQQQQAPQQTYMPPGGYTPQAQQMMQEQAAADDGSGAMAPSASPGAWASMPVGGKIAIGVGIGGAIAGLIWAVSRRSGPPSGYRPRRYA